MHASGRFLIVRDMQEAGVVCDYITRAGAAGGGMFGRSGFLANFEKVASPGFDPDLHLGRLGVANQTTMLSSESLAIAGRLREAIAARYGEAALAGRFRSFDTICSATQDRQDAVIHLVQEGVDLLIIIGGYNSSNTNHLAAIGTRSVPTYHIDSPECILGPGAIRHKPAGARDQMVTRGWLPAGRLTIGVTAGASTPNVMIGEVIDVLQRCRKPGSADPAK
jgi:4-hydroxy-3-methylbut-2-enyl diphosphate reductase